MSIQSRIDKAIHRILNMDTAAAKTPTEHQYKNDAAEHKKRVLARARNDIKKRQQERRVRRANLTKEEKKATSRGEEKKEKRQCQKKQQQRQHELLLTRWSLV